MKRLLLALLFIPSLSFSQAAISDGARDHGAMRLDGSNTATGTAALPAYSFSSDPDTGIYSPGANILGFSVGGAEKIVVNSTGLGIGTTPGVLAHFKNTGNPLLYLEDTAGARFFIQSVGNADVRMGAASNTPLLVMTDSTERMRITSGGNVLIATSTDDGNNKLQVNGFTKLGEAATGIKMKVLTGTTAATEGGTITIAHGLDVTKVISFSATVISGATEEAIAMDSTPAIIGAGYLFSCFLNATNAVVDLSDSDSEGILSKTVLVTIWYKE